MSSPTPTVDAALAILAGGAGRRLGGFPKGQLVIGGERVIDRLWSLHSLFQWAFVVANDHSVYSAPGRPSVADWVGEKGAPGGVVTALAAAKTEWCFVLACDAPLVTARDVLALWQHAGAGIDAVCFSSAARGPEPLIAFYRTALSGRFASTLHENPSMHRLLQSVRVHSVEAPAHVLVNLNTPEDLKSVGATRESF